MDKVTTTNDRQTATLLPQLVLEAANNISFIVRQRGGERQGIEGTLEVTPEGVITDLRRKDIREDRALRLIYWDAVGIESVRHGATYMLSIGSQTYYFDKDGQIIKNHPR